MCWLLVFFSATTQDMPVGGNGRRRSRRIGGGLDAGGPGGLMVLAGQRLY